MESLVPSSGGFSENQQQQYPCLSKLALSILSAHAMSADTERVFSNSRRTVDQTRPRLSPQFIEANECIKSWNQQGLITADQLEYIEQLGEEEASLLVAEGDIAEFDDIDEQEQTILLLYCDLIIETGYPVNQPLCARV